MVMVTIYAQLYQVKVWEKEGLRTYFLSVYVKQTTEKGGSPAEKYCFRPDNATPLATGVAKGQHSDYRPGYIVFGWLFSLQSQGVTFIIRAKSNLACKILGQHKKPNTKRDIISDQLIEFTNHYESKAYPETLRLIRYRYTDKNGNEKEIAVLTNNMTLAASTIAALYKGRWEFETFFRWIKQNLRIKSFIGTSQNAVMTQVWVAMILYLLLSFIKFQTRFTAPMSELLRIIREILLDTRSLIEYLRLNWAQFIKIREGPVQLSLV